MIFVALGTQDLPFNRLLKKLDELVKEKRIKQPVFAQTGYSTYVPQYYSFKEMLSFEEFDTKMAAAEIVVSHGGTGSLVGALKRGKKVIAVPRRKKYGEHVDDHQIEIVDVFEKAGLLIRVDEMQDLEGALKRIESFTAGVFVSRKAQMLQLLEAFIESD